MKYTVTIPCQTRRVGDVDENLLMYKWCVDNGYTYTQLVSKAGCWSWEFVKVLTEEEEKTALEKVKNS